MLIHPLFSASTTLKAKGRRAKGKGPAVASLLSNSSPRPVITRGIKGDKEEEMVLGDIIIDAFTREVAKGKKLFLGDS